MHNMGHMGPYLQSFLPFVQKKMGFNRPPTIFFDSDPENAENVLGKTGFYDPELEEIVIYVDKRHPKDILRSLSHELIHHTQNCRGDLNPEIAGETGPGYAQNNPHMRTMESEAYQNGNLYFRDWEDSVKFQLQETNYKHITGDNHKMATYDQLKEQITAKVVAALTEKLNEGKKKPDGDGDGVPPWADKDDNDPEVQEEAVEEVNEDEEIEERKKRDTPRDSTRLEPQKLKVQESEEELEERKKRDTPRDSEGRREAPKLKVNEEEDPKPEDDPEVDPREKEEEIQETVEETISNDQWYQNELFESLTKKWTK